MAKIFFKTYGCAHNQSDSEVMMGLLSKAGHEIVNSESSAELVVFNTCTVKDPSEKKFFSELEKINKPVVVAGCIPQADMKNKFLTGYSLIGVKQIDKIVEVVKETLNGNSVQFLKHENNERLNLPKIRRNPLVEIIPISSGCLGYCTFCKTKFARSGLVSFAEVAIVKQFRTALNEGVKEVWLTSEDTGAYGQDIGTSLPTLLKKLLAVNKDFRIRIGMINPEHVKRDLKELVEIFQDHRMFKFLHIPVQAGNDRVLKEMKRPYTVEDFKDSVAFLRENISGVTIATDIICGFPTETAEEFEETLDLVKELAFPVVNISKFYPRAGTKAAAMKLLPTKTAKARSKALTELLERIHTNKGWLGWTGEILIDEIGKTGSFIGRNDSYRPVVIKGEGLLGKRIKVKIVSVFKDYLEGKIIN